MDYTTIISTGITGVLALASAVLVACITNHSNNKKNEQKTKQDIEREARRDQQISDYFARNDERMTRIERKLDEHNGYAQKFGEVAVGMTSLKKDVEFLKELGKKK